MRTDFDAAAARRIALRETASMVGLGLLLPFGFLASRHKPLRRRDLRTVVLVHGMGSNRGSFYPLQAWLRISGHDRQLAFNHRSGPSIEALAVQLKRVVDSEVHGGRIDLVAHSLGGLVSRVYLQMLGGDRRVDRLITLGTPHRGTYASLWAPSAFVRQLDPDGPFLSHLNGLPPPRTAVTSLVAESDALVLPREAAICPFGEVRRFPALGHNGLLTSPAVFRTVTALLAGS